MYFNGLLLLSAQFVRIATNDMLVITNGTVFVSAHRVQIATGTTPGSGCTSCFVSAHRVQIATVDETGRCYVYRLCLSAPRADRNKSRLHPTSRASLCLSAPRADRNRGSSPISRTTSALSQRIACRSQRQMCTKHRVRICGMRCKSVDSFSQHEDLLRADYFPELFCYQSSLRCH